MSGSQPGFSGQLAQQQQPQQGSQTQTQVQEPSQQQQTQTQETQPSTILRLRGAHANPAGHRVQWAENVVDNEGLGRKSSKGTSTPPYPSPFRFPIPVIDIVEANPPTNQNSLLHIPRAPRSRGILRRIIFRRIIIIRL